MVEYGEQVKSLAETDDGFARVEKELRALKGIEHPRVLLFSHHDLDGVSGAAIVRRSLELHFGAEVTTLLPPHFRLSERELELEMAFGPFDALVVVDKGTFGYYDSFLHLIERVLVIDHHPLDGKPKRIAVFNPSMERPVPAAAALLCHMLATRLGMADDFDDLFALIGCRGDFAFDPVERTCSEFVAPFLEHVKRKFGYMFEVKRGEPTFFDLVHRDRTTFINQLGELLHVGCIGHMYPEEGITYGPELVLDTLLELAEKRVDLANPTSLEGMVGNLSTGEKLTHVHGRFKSDWRLLSGRAEDAIFLREVRGVGIYMIFAKEAPSMHSAPFPAILPCVASTRLEELKRSGGHEHAMVVVFCPKERGVHISMRGGGGVLDCGRLCGELADRVQAACPGRGEVVGGGHDRAAECVVNKPVPMYVPLHHLLSLLRELK